MIFISPSQMETWVCQKRWALDKVDKVAKAPSEYLLFGDVFHAVIEAYYRSTFLATPANLLTLLDLARFQLNERRAAIDPYGLLLPILPRLHRRMTLMVATFYTSAASQYTMTEIPEHEFQALLAEDVTLTGRVDAVSATLLHDWKTASSMKRWTPGIEHDKLQATAYLVGRPTLPALRFSIFVSNPYRPTACTLIERTTTRTPAQLAAFRLNAITIGRDMLAAKASHRFPASPDWYCAWCDVLGSCASGQRYLRQKHIHPAIAVVTAQGDPYVP